MNKHSTPHSSVSFRRDGEQGKLGELGEQGKQREQSTNDEAQICSDLDIYLRLILCF
ncbi:hypothetical protein MC7420_717 [Coleofasciculus chthonoplastes PCC 7420]|uniref:Uncharacterized protein n=1 Tax=Coleofasciculus chthonoplastes PCC 7420 TaxID=118168 RepID=B4VSW9_9CYAN|nr:hypothetical protein MC7420_717 [Coleofasciculus chthonoplastes PCC 7420]